MPFPSDLQSTASEDRSVVFKSAASGETFIALGDGRVLPYRQWMQASLFEFARPFFLSPESNITAVNGRKLAGVVGALLARQSRARGTVMDVLASEFLVTTEEEVKNVGLPLGSLRERKLDQLIERILIQYGDDSVQELETATVLFNSVSNLATKAIEDRRLGAFIEQSSRYVLYTERDPVTGGWSYYRPEFILSSPISSDYLQTMDACFDMYAALAEKLQEYYRSLKPMNDVTYVMKPNDPQPYRFEELDDDQQRKQFQRSYTFDIRTRACDTARLMLPAATLTNVAMVANGRTFEHLLKRLYSSGRPEFQDIGNRLHDTLNKVIPKYVKRAERLGNMFWMATDQEIKKDLAGELPGAMLFGGSVAEVTVHQIPRLLSRDRSARDHLLAAVYFPYARTDYLTLVHAIEQLPETHMQQLLLRAVGKRSVRRDRSPRGFEHGYDVTAEVVMDFGAFRDLHRHRMCTLQWQRPNPHLGVVSPADVETVGMAGSCRALEERVRNLYDRIAQALGSETAEYATLFGHKLRFLLGMNLREAQHFLEIRTVMQGHAAYRRVCQKIHAEIKKQAPWLDNTDLFKFVDHNDYPWARAAAEARQSQKILEMGGEKLETGGSL
jgi:thymidylate synthase ThyX